VYYFVGEIIAVFRVVAASMQYYYFEKSQKVLVLFWLRQFVNNITGKQ